MNLRQLHYFSVLAEARTFHGAARLLNISQPPLTVAIKRLEDELEIRLFERTSRGVQLTPAGEAALQPARDVLSRVGRIKEAAHRGARGEIGHLSVGFVGSAVARSLPRIVSTFRLRFPGVELDLREMTAAAIMDAIISQELDVGLARMPLTGSAQLAVHVIEADLLVAALPAAHRLAGHRLLDLKKLSEDVFIMPPTSSVLHATILLACHDAGFQVQSAQQAVQLQTILGLVEAGMGVALVPSAMTRFASNHITLCPLEKDVPTHLSLVFREDGGALERNFAQIALEEGDSFSLSI